MKILSRLAILLSFSLILTGCEAVNLPANNNLAAPVVEEANNVNQVVLNQNVNTNIAQPAVVQNTKPVAVPAKKISPEKEYYLVIKVVDGDTLDLNINGATERIRLIGIDTPEVVDPRKPVQCFGLEASNQAKAVLTGQSVALEKDPSQGERDKYGRLLGYIFLRDGTNFNKQMIREGYAYEYTYNLPYKYQTEFKAAENYARINKLGLWADDSCIDVATPVSTNTNTNSNTNTAAATGCVIKGNITTEKIYHLPGCGSYYKTTIDESKGERWFCTETEAVAAGWRKAKNCP
jgi:micrococcal nuclease